jgi:2-polyprenyl-6-methoxyphenol hydroxylase-like FAD-dependent oxidoreductase
MEDQLFDIIIVGRGPVGLFLACELRHQGVSVLVLERCPRTGLDEVAELFMPVQSRCLSAIYGLG